MFNNKLVRDGKPKAAASGSLAAPLVQAVEWPESGLYLIGRNAGSAIGDLDGHFMSTAIEVDFDWFPSPILHGIFE